MMTPELRAEVDAAIDWMTAPKPLALGANQHQDLADIATWLRSVDSAKARLAGFAPALTAHIDAQAKRIAELERDNARLRECVAKAADQFGFYVTEHRAKGTPTAYAKAETNERMRDILVAALAERMTDED